MKSASDSLVVEGVEHFMEMQRTSAVMSAAADEEGRK